jgi:hypothetical protein
VFTGKYLLTKQKAGMCQRHILELITPKILNGAIANTYFIKPNLLPFPFHYRPALYQHGSGPAQSHSRLPKNFFGEQVGEGREEGGGGL